MVVDVELLNSRARNGLSDLDEDELFTRSKEQDLGFYVPSDALWGVWRDGGEKLNEVVSVHSEESLVEDDVVLDVDYFVADVEDVDVFVGIVVVVIAVDAERKDVFYVV